MSNAQVTYLYKDMLRMISDIHTVHSQIAELIVDNELDNITASKGMIHSQFVKKFSVELANVLVSKPNFDIIDIINLDNELSDFIAYFTTIKYNASHVSINIKLASYINFLSLY